MDGDPPTPPIPALPSEIRARLRADRLAHAGGPWTHVCITCGATFTATRTARQHCFSCWPVFKRRPRPKEQPKERPAGPKGPVRRSYADRPRSKAKRGQIAADARAVVADRGQTCQRCAYTLFVEICHIRPIASFPSTALVREINAPDNLIVLCPNCHHELDAGLWTVERADRTDLPGSPRTRSIPAQRASWRHSPYRGVHWDKLQQKWRAVIFSAGKVRYLGRFADERDAARAYNAAALRLRGERAILNDVD